MKLIVGLGNPGKEYENTRHNVGFKVIDNYKNKISSIDYKNKFNGQYFEFKNDSEKIMLLKPLSYMNLSGEVVKKYVDYFNIKTEDILVIYDDMDFNLGTFKIKKCGSSAGHNGMKNIIDLLKTENIKRIRIGISKSNYDKKDYVLGKFNSSEIKELDNVISKTEDIIDEYPKLDFEKLMSKYN